MTDAPRPSLPEDPQARAWIERLGMQPHPEGGWYVETWRDDGHVEALGERGAGTAIYFLLARGESSAWHRVDATEIWHYYAGAPLELRVADDDAGPVRIELLGADPSLNQRPQRIVPPHAWQAARSSGAWTLVGCTVSPGFSFSGFEMAAPGWEPGIRE